MTILLHDVLVRNSSTVRIQRSPALKSEVGLFVSVGSASSAQFILFTTTMADASRPSFPFFRSLPVEILMVIFVLALPPTGDHESGVVTSRAISQVCSQYWRRVAVDTGTLWTHITFPDPPPFDFTNLLLERSRGCLLDIAIDVGVFHSSTQIDSTFAWLQPAIIRHTGSFALMSG
jgi:hypothetical protein